ncbi:Hypothetical predicted protein [Mytilus galloprovincialis]|uniref:Uncharacterized protein n=1 Tax=Mytilus galloprovincialis TaxID=29158 RepID=A0A8B6HHM1_MYTGA|nr:Hypothetical predicted protein [Mytilus galloprovincialis]
MSFNLETTEDNYNTILTSDHHGKFIYKKSSVTTVDEELPFTTDVPPYLHNNMAEDPNLLYDNKGKVKRPYNVETEIYQPGGDKQYPKPIHKNLPM